MQRQKIILVEDEQAIADTLVYVLGSEGFDVCHVALGSEAWGASGRALPGAARMALA